MFGVIITFVVCLAVSWLIGEYMGWNESFEDEEWD
jgi:hypothetical protein